MTGKDMREVEVKLYIRRTWQSCRRRWNRPAR